MPKLTVTKIGREKLAKRLISAAINADWQQVTLNGGPPCFHLENDGDFCLRAKRWQGHGGVAHQYVPLADLLKALA